ncbi:hypothetical protein SAMN02982929_04947 [Saccharopolyspora kobensis]|uniref:Uncharacterized protein n=1 Tax=Saccharopolyspora kobensis TaxID=146035 RepID=A0A1H6DUY2_9PSEU|nr:hypothetical protein [Saccharopolyspora kobensis]SEG88385.1 hypothetical protein SAMN02982929_04947 [Saccharopolyspora kobensis]SFE01346.1 hypothetical protein SAMN05216506_10881 [Saccharopolyspora kobensis]
MGDSDETRLRQLVAEALEVRSAPGKPPVLSLWGASGTELPEALEALVERWGPIVPAAHVTRAQLHGDSMLEVLLRLTEQLSRSARWRSAPRFPRFALGVLASQGKLESSLPDARRDEMINRTLGGKLGGGRALVNWLNQTGTALAEAFGVPSTAAAWVGTATGSAAGYLHRALLLRGKPLQWYRNEITRANVGTGVDGLIELARKAALHPDNKDAVAPILCRAVVADLAAWQQTRPSVFKRSRRCLIVFDRTPPERTPYRVQGNGVQQVIRELAELRATDAGPRTSPALLVEAGPLRPVIPGQAASLWRPELVANSRYQGWDPARGDGWKLRYPLVWRPAVNIRATSRQQEGSFTTQVALSRKLPANSSADLRPLVTTLRRLTGDHPGATAVLMDAIAAHAHEHGGQLPDPRGLCELTTAGRRFDEWVIELATARWPAAIRPGVIQFALLRTLTDECTDQVYAPLRNNGAGVGSDLAQFLSRDAWVEYDPDDPAAPPVIHPLLRRAVAHQVGARAFRHVVWETWHTQIAVAMQKSDPVTALYHKLAAGKVADVVDALEAWLGESTLGAKDWLGRLEAITQAPLARVTTSQPVVEHHHELVSSAGAVDEPVLARLVLAMQLHNDPLGDPHHSMCAVIAHGLAALGDKYGPAGTFHDHATIYQDCHTRWRNFGE